MKTSDDTWGTLASVCHVDDRGGFDPLTAGVGSPDKLYFEIVNLVSGAGYKDLAGIRTP